MNKKDMYVAINPNNYNDMTKRNQDKPPKIKNSEFEVVRISIRNEK